MKNRSKILSPRESQIRREFSDSAEYAATGFSGLCSSTKSKLQKVVSKLSGVCNTMMGLIFPKSEISVQQRDLYTFRLDSISNVIKNPLPGPKPFHSDSGTMPPTPGRFNSEEDEKANKKFAFYSADSSNQPKEKPKYGVPLWKQFNKDLAQSSENKLKNFSDKKSPENSESVKNNSDKKNSTGKPAAALEKVNPNSTPIGHHAKENKPHVFVKADNAEKADSEKKVSDLDNTPRFFKCLQDVPSGVKSASEFVSESSFFDITPEHRSEEKKLKETEQGVDMVVPKADEKLEEKKVGVADEGLKEVKKAVGFFVPDNEKVLPEFEEGFLTSGSTSKSSSPSFKSLNPKDEPVADLKLVSKAEDIKSSSDKPNPFAVEKNTSLTETSKIPNPFASLALNSIAGPIKDSTPLQEFVSRPHISTSSSFSNPFKPPQNNPFDISAKESTQVLNTLDQSTKILNNPFASSSIASNPFGMSSSSHLPLTPFPSKSSPDLNQEVKTSNDPKEVLASIPNPFIVNNSDLPLTPYPNKGNLGAHDLKNPFAQLARSEPNPFNSGNPASNPQENKVINPFAQTSSFNNPFSSAQIAENKIRDSNNAPQNVNYIAPADTIKNPFAQSDQSKASQPNPDGGLFNIGTIPTRVIVKGKRPYGP